MQENFDCSHMYVLIVRGIKYDFSLTKPELLNYLLNQIVF